MDFTFVRQLPGTLWSAVIMELLERLAYYGMFLVLSIYLMDHIGITADVYGLVVPGIFASVLYLLPLFAGVLADKFGYRPALMVAFATLTAGYTLLGASSTFAWICVALALIAVGGSIIKPVIAGSVTHTTEEGSTRPVGFGLYYMMINVGGFVGPVLAAIVRDRFEFRFVFWVSAAACAVAFLMALFAFKEPLPEEIRASRKSIAEKTAEMIMVLGNWRFVLLLVIFSGFWGMINVLFGFMPHFIENLTDLDPLRSWVGSLPIVGSWLVTIIKPEVFVSLDALMIMTFQAPIAYLTRRWPTLRAMLVGTTIAAISWILPAMSPVAWFVAAGILVWSIGEMLASPRYFEYCGTVAPPDQVAVYLGYSFFAIFIGNFVSGPWAGWLYERFVRGPLEAGVDPTPAPFFAGVIAMGAFSVIGLALYGRFVMTEPARPTGENDT
jgi:dipeptide/tripeptide permease